MVRWIGYVPVWPAERRNFSTIILVVGSSSTTRIFRGRDVIWETTVAAKRETTVGVA